MQARKIFILATFQIAVTISPVFAEIYKWTDKQGNVHFGDQPPSEENAKQLHIKGGAANISPRLMPKMEPQQEKSQSTSQQIDKPKETVTKEYATAKHQCFDVYKASVSSDDVQTSYISHTLSDQDVSNLTQLFKSLYRSWKGNLIKIDCRGTASNPQEKRDAFKARMSGKWSLTGKLELDINYQNKEKRSRKHYYWWLIEDSKLYFGDRRDIRSALKWVIDVVSISSNKLVFRKKISRTNRLGAAIKHAQVIEIYATPVSMSMTELLYDRSGMLVSMHYWNLQR